MLDLHSANGILLALTSTALLPATILLVRPGRGPWWPIVVSFALWATMIFQIGVGFARLVGLHIPVGTALMGLITAFTWWAFSYRPGRHPSTPPPKAPPATVTPTMASAPGSTSPPAPDPVVATIEALPRRQP